jgi:hypothetical protein
MLLSTLAESKEQQKERCAVHLRPIFDWGFDATGSALQNFSTLRNGH